MFAQFRSQYPQGSIKTELLPQKVDGMHVFRVAIADGELTLSTATAADSDLEVAEDRAVKRGLILAGISLDVEPRIKATLMPSESRLEPRLESRPELKPEYDSARPMPRFVPESPQISAHIASNYEELQTDLSVDFQSNSIDFNRVNAEPAPVKPTKAPEPISSPKVLEFSDAIAQTNVELMRLGWSEEQGRDYLMRTYKKNSRSRLTPDEINRFLNYLKSQTVDHPPF